MYDWLRISRFRGLRGLLLAALACVSLNAFASFPAPPNYSTAAGHCGGASFTDSTKAGVCNKLLGFYVNTCTGAINSGVAGVQVLTSPDRCHLTQNNGGPGYDASIGTIAGTTCPANSTGTTTCTCTSPNVENATHDGCVPPKCLPGATGFYRGAIVGGNLTPFDACLDGCTTSFAAQIELGITVTSAGNSYATYKTTKGGGECVEATAGTPDAPVSGATPTQPAPEPDCPEGQRRAYLNNGTPTCQPIPVDRFCPPSYTYGTVNGKDTCISQGTSPPTSTSPATVTKTVATESKSTTTTSTNPDGSTATTTITSDGKGGGSTTTTTKKLDGSSETVTTKMDSPKTEADKKCEPGTAGCATLDAPADGTVSKNDVQVGNVQPYTLTGFNIGNGCPADLTLDLAMAGTHKLSFKGACDAAPLVKPLVLLAAAFMSLMIVYAALTAKAS